jgi:polysaccharide chain length determinant protein (PEP-CTERM system associated)
LEGELVLPGQKYTPEDIARILWHRKWLILVPLVAASASSFVIARQLPSTYRSETLLQLIPQRIPESYIPKTGTTPIEDRLNSIRQVILSRSRLEAIIQEFNLYADARRTGVMEDIVERMRTKDIGITVERGDAFRLSYVADDPRIAKKVAERLASHFIDENTREREALAEQTTQFLDAKLEDARQRLSETEKRLEGYKRLHSTELPSQVQANIQAMSGARQELARLAESVNRDRDRRLLLEQQIADLQTTAVAPPVPPVRSQAAPDGETGASTADQLEFQKARLQLLLIRLKDTHPDVVTTRRLIRDLEARMQTEGAGRAGTGEAAVAAATPAEVTRQNRLRTLRAELQNLDQQFNDKLAKEKELTGFLSSLQARLDAAPKHESQLIELMRDYDTINSNYKSLLQTRENAKLASDVVRQQIGEQFRVLDAARLPERPHTPDRPRLLLMGSALGLAIGLGLIALLEYRDTTFKSEDEVLRLLQLPVLALVPLMASERELRMRRRRTVLIGLAAGVMIVSSVAALALWKLQGA